MKTTELTKSQIELIEFFSIPDCKRIAKHLKLVFEAAAFESDIAQSAEINGKDALFTVYHLSELVSDMVNNS